MSEHHANIVWKRGDKAFEYPVYSRSHLWRFQSGIEVRASAATQFLGTADRVDPEEAFVASISSCHMLTFLALCARKRITVESYEDNAVGYLEENSTGKLTIARVSLAPDIVFAGSPLAEETIEKLHERAHSECFIANSVNTRISLAG